MAVLFHLPQHRLQQLGFRQIPIIRIQLAQLTNLVLDDTAHILQLALQLPLLLRNYRMRLLLLVQVLIQRGLVGLRFLPLIFHVQM